MAVIRTERNVMRALASDRDLIGGLAPVGPSQNLSSVPVLRLWGDERIGREYL